MNNMTNADRIRNMTDNGLAMYLSLHFDCDTCPLSKIEDIWNESYCTGKHNSCVLNLRDWLKQDEDK